MSRKHIARATLACLAAAVVAFGIWSTLPTSQPLQAADVGLIKSVIAPAAVSFADAKTGSIKGKVTFKGTFKELAPIHAKGKADVKDSAVCAAADMPNESLVVDLKGGNGIANVVIYMAKAPEGYKAPPVPKTVTVDFDQKGCRFNPHCLAVRVGQTVLVKSGDSVAHNTHTSPIRSMGFNKIIAPNERQGVPLVYDKAERIPVEVKCDLHTWMKAYHCVQDHPFMVVTDDKGEFELKDVPAGKHTFIVWQESAGYLSKAEMVTVVAGKPTEIDLSYGPDKFKAK